MWEISHKAKLQDCMALINKLFRHKKLASGEADFYYILCFLLRHRFLNGNCNRNRCTDEPSTKSYHRFVAYIRNTYQIVFFYAFLTLLYGLKPYLPDYLVLIVYLGTCCLSFLWFWVSKIYQRVWNKID